MTIRKITLAAAFVTAGTFGVLAQQAQPQQQMQHPSGGQMAMSAESLPEESGV